MAIHSTSTGFAPESVRTAEMPVGILMNPPGMPVVSPPVNVHQLLERVAQDLRRELTAKRLELTMKLSARGYLVAGDREWMRQVYTNLLSNAVTYARKGGQITVRSTCPSQDALRVEVSCS
jgi:signal transduction histidine kinase